MSPTRFLRRTILVAAMFAACAAGPAAARSRHHHRVSQSTAAAPAAPAEKPVGFYPNEVEGGVSGNLPFNNQIRKMKDPLNANGAGR